MKPRLTFRPSSRLQWILILAFISTTLILIWIRRPTSLADSAERILKAHLTNDCHVIYDSLSEQERISMGISKSGYCRLMNELVFSRIDGATINRIKSKSASSETGTCQVDLSLPDNRDTTIRIRAYRGAEGPRTTFLQSLAMAWKIDAAKSAPVETSDISYLANGINQDYQSLKNLGVRKLYYSSSSLSLVSVDALRINLNRDVNMINTARRIQASRSTSKSSD